MKTLKEKIEVMQAALDGKGIEFRPAETDHEWRIIDDPLFVWGDYDYHIKQEPIEFWVTVYDSGTTACWLTEKEANDNLSSLNSKTIKVREVLDD